MHYAYLRRNTDNNDDHQFSDKPNRINEKNGSWKVDDNVFGDSWPGSKRDDLPTTVNFARGAHVMLRSHLSLLIYRRKKEHGAAYGHQTTPNWWEEEV